jgi:hypothetical protein
MTETIPHVMRYVTTGEATTIQLKPREGMTMADVEALLAERKAAGLLIDPENCEVMRGAARHLRSARRPRRMELPGQGTARAQSRQRRTRSLLGVARRSA